ncbi:MAG: hypothetical protein ACYDC2_03230 [Solirubrobacteraceae bacterium]
MTASLPAALLCPSPGVPGQGRTWRSVAPPGFDVGRCGVCDGEIRPGDTIFVTATLAPSFVLHRCSHAPDCSASLMREARGR